MSHLLELRDRLMRAGGAVLVLFIMAAPFANTLYEYLAQPLMASLPEGNSMISTEPHGPFFVPFKFAFAFAAAVAMPYLLYQLWAFVAPGLYEHEKKLTVPLLVSSSVLFYLGILFAYFVVFPVIFAFFTSTAPDGVLVMTDISAYLSFVLKLFFAFGLAFEVPVATVLLVRMGMTTPDALATKRPYIIVGAFVAGMLMTQSRQSLSLAEASAATQDLLAPCVQLSGEMRWDGRTDGRTDRHHTISLFHCFFIVFNDFPLAFSVLPLFSLVSFKQLSFKFPDVVSQLTRSSEGF